MSTSAITTVTAQPRKINDAGKALKRYGWAAPLVLAAAYLVLLAAQFGQLLANVYLSADNAAGPVMGELYDGSGHHLVILGHSSWFSTVLFERWTLWLPAHRQLWELAPYAMALSSVAFVGWGVWRIAGRWAGAAALAVMVCAGPSLLTILMVADDHAPTWFTLALIGAFLAVLELGVVASGGWLAVLAVVVGVLLGVNAESDVLLTISGAVPLLLTVVCIWALYPSRRTARAVWFAVASLLVALAAGLVVHGIMNHDDVINAHDPKISTLAGTEVIGTNFKLWWQSLAVLGNGDFFGMSVGFSALIAFACAAITLVSVFFVPRIAHSELARAIEERRGSPRYRNPRAAGEVARSAWCLFWASSAVLLSLAFVFSAGPEDITSSRYLVGVIYAVAALVPMLGLRNSLLRVTVTAGATLYAFAGCLALAQERIQAPASPTDPVAAAVANIAKAEHMSIGYAGYWDASPITWATHFHVKVFPVGNCGNQRLCGFELAIDTAWYTPRPRIHTFLLDDPTYTAAYPLNPPPDLGRPIAAHQIGNITMYVYPYDIASRLYAL
jgi:hypothetical protein